MSNKALFEEIFKAEADAKTKVEAAKKEAEDIINEAHQRAIKLIEEGSAEIEKKREKVYQQALKSLETKKEKILEKGELELKELKSISKKNRAKAVEFILKKLEEEVE